MSFSTGSLYTYPLATAFALAQQAGLRDVELVLGPESLWRGAVATGRLAAAYGLTIRSVHPPVLPLPGWTDPATVLQRLLAYAGALSPQPLVVLHAPRLRRIAETAMGRRFLEALAAWRAGPSASRVPIALETPGLFSAADRALELFGVAALAAFAAREGLATTLDTAHVGSLPCNPLDAYALLRDGLANIHLSDLRPVPALLDISLLQSYIKHHQLPGDGILPLAALLRALRRDGYAGLLTLELSPLALGFWSRARVRQQLARTVVWVGETSEVGTLADAPEMGPVTVQAAD